MDLCMYLTPNETGLLCFELRNTFVVVYMYSHTILCSTRYGSTVYIRIAVVVLQTFKSV